MLTTNSEGEQRVSSKKIAVHPSILVIGLGNPILGDDGIGWRVVEDLANQINANQVNPLAEIEFPVHFTDLDVEFDCLAVGGLALMERVIGYNRVLIIDSMVTRENPIGAVKRLSLSEADLLDARTGHLTSSHDTSFTNALRVGRAMGAKIPEKITILGIEINEAFDFSEELSPEVLASIQKTCELSMELIK